VEPAVSETITVKWYSLIRKVAVETGSTVKQGDLIAETALDYLDFRKRYFLGKEKFAKKYLGEAREEERLVIAEQKRLQGLAAKGVLSVTEVDKVQVKVVDSVLRRMRAEKEIADIRTQLLDTQNQIQKANYFAPISGVVTEIIANPKQMMGSVIAMPEAKVARIDQPGRYIVKASALDTQVIHLKQGMTADVIFEGSGERISSKITNVTTSETAEKDNMRFFDVYFEFAREGRILPRGFMVRVEVPISEGKKLPTVPWNAVRTDGTRAFVLKHEKDYGWKEVEVEIGARGRHRVEIMKGLKAGDIVSATLW
jgi:RND family efflux transporter MFP subunit